MSDLPADTLTTTIANVLAEHVRSTGLRDGIPSLDIHCNCGWTHPDRFIQNGDIHRAHVAAAVVSVLATHNQHTAADALRDAADAALNEPEDVLPEIRPVARWLRARADRLAAVSPTPPTHKEQA